MNICVQGRRLYNQRNFKASRSQHYLRSVLPTAFTINHVRERSSVIGVKLSSDGPGFHEIVLIIQLTPP
jgi:hypothetical protein